MRPRNTTFLVTTSLVILNAAIHGTINWCRFLREEEGTVISTLQDELVFVQPELQVRRHFGRGLHSSKQKRIGTSPSTNVILKSF